MTTTKQYDFRKLALGLIFDAIGMLSFVIPFVGSFTDIIWAPIAGWLMTRMYKGKAGQAAGLFTFVEELIPGMDIIPTFTIMWFYTYVFKGAKNEKTIEV